MSGFERRSLRAGSQWRSKGNRNYYLPAVVQERALEEEIRQFLDQVVGPETENLDLVKEILAETKRST